MRHTSNSKTTKSANKKRLSAASYIHSSSSLLFILVFAIIGSFFIYTSFANNDEHTPTLPIGAHQKNQLLIRFRENVPQDTQDKLLNRFNGQRVDELPAIKVKIIVVPEQALENVRLALSKNPAIEYVENNYLGESTYTPNDPYYNGSAGTTSVINYQWPFTTTRTNLVWDKTRGQAATLIAVVDTGQDTTLTDTGLTVPGWNVESNNADTTPVNPHGTYVSGVINARSDNNIGVASVCPGCTVMPVKISNTSDGYATYSAMAKGIIYAADHGAKIINFSYSGTTSSITLNDAISYARSKNSLVFAAAGNNGDTTLNYPAASPGAVSVAALSGNTGTSLASSSTRGDWVKLAAPTGVYTTWFNNAYAPVGGTSIATPFVSGVAGLLWSLNPGASNSQIESALYNSAITLPDVHYGRIDALAAMQALNSTPAPVVDSIAPVTSITNPLSGTTVSGQVSITINATDSYGVARVELYRNGVLIGTDTTSPYSFYWDTLTAPNGNYSLQSKAYDSAGNNGASAILTLTVSNVTQIDSVAPVVTISAPVDGATVARQVDITAKGTDAVGVTTMEAYVDGKLVGSSTTGSLITRWNAGSKSVAKGRHTITIRAHDAAGNTGERSIVIYK